MRSRLFALVAMLLVGWSTRASAQMTPVSWSLHATAGADGTTDSPPDVTLGAVYGSNAVNASATAPSGQHGTFGVDGTFTATQLSMHLGGSATTPVGAASAGGSGNGDILFSVSSPTSIEIEQLRGGAFSFGASTWLINSSNVNVYTGSSSTVAMILAPDTYTLRGSGSIGPNAGNSASGFILTTINVVPEPASASLLALGAAGVLRRRRRA